MFRFLDFLLQVQREHLQSHLETNVSHHLALACHVLINSEGKAREAEQKFNKINKELQVRNYYSIHY